MYCQYESTKKFAPAFEPNPFPEPRTIPTGWDMTDYLTETEEMYFPAEAEEQLRTDTAP